MRKEKGLLSTLTAISIRPQALPFKYYLPNLRKRPLNGQVFSFTIEPGSIHSMQSTSMGTVPFPIIRAGSYSQCVIDTNRQGRQSSIGTKSILQYRLFIFFITIQIMSYLVSTIDASLLVINT
jgi:hypothetical protein